MTRPLQRPAGRAGIRLGAARRLGLWAGAAVVAVVPLAVTAVAGASPAAASATVAPRPGLRHGAGALPGRGLTLAQAPAGLRAAVRRTLGAPAAAAAGAFEAKLTASDGALYDSFGLSVAISGSTALVGAPGKNSGAGAAYVFTGSGGIWMQRAELTATDAAPGDIFGVSVALSGSTALIGAFRKNSNAGAAYVFTGSAGSWTQRKELTAADAAPGDNFGVSVALSGSTALIGAFSKSTNAGAAYVFTGSGSSWTQRKELTAADAAPGDLFGVSVALSGSTALIGAYGKNSNAGAAYVVTGSGSTWTQRKELTAADAAPGDLFGRSVALSGSTALIGAYGKNSNAGAAYVFTGSGSTWTQRKELTAADAAPGINFGSSVALYRSTALVGAPTVNTGAGAAYVFAGSGGTWTQRAKLTAADDAADGEFGSSVAISGSTPLVGAPGKNGAAYVFGLPYQQGRLTATGGAAADQAGLSVAISGSTAVVGAPGRNAVTGAVYVFTLSLGVWSQRAVLTAAGGAVNSYFGWVVAISGSTVLVGAPGVNGFTGAAYVFTGSGATWAQQKVLTASDPAGGDQFGRAVALSGSTALVGAPDKNANAGAVYVFIGSGATWAQQKELTAADSAASAYFGWSLALSGPTALIGTPGKNTSTGAVYVFTGSGASWAQQAELTASDPATTAYFGWSVGMSGSTAVIGAPGNYNYAGTAYVFTGAGASWAQQAELAPADRVPNDKFGLSVAIAGSAAVIAAPLKYSAAGALYLYGGSGGGWPLLAELTAADAAAGDDLGSSVAISGTTAIAGAPGKNTQTGAAYAYANM
jgi:hypothetical protein